MEMPGRSGHENGECDATTGHPVRHRGPGRQCNRGRVPGPAWTAPGVRPPGLTGPGGDEVTAGAATLPAPTRPSSGTQPRGDRTRAVIIDEAVACVLEEGCSAASAKHITERAGVTWGVIQYHFGSRDGLLAAVVESGFEQLRASMAGLVLPTGPARERIRVLVDTAWTAFSSPTSRAALEILIATRPGRDPLLERHLAGMNRELRRLGRNLGGPADHGLGNLLWAVLRGLVMEQMMVEGTVNSARQRAMMVDVLAAYVEAAS